MTKVSRTHDRERSHGLLLDAGLKLFAERGYHGVTLDEIAELSGLSKRMPYYYFGSKEGLYRAVLTEVYRRVETIEFRAFESARTPTERLKALVQGYFDFLDKNPEFTQLIQWGNLEKGEHFPKGTFVKMHLLERLREIVKEGIESGEFRSDMNVPHLLINVLGLTFIYYSNHYSLSSGLKMDLGSGFEREQAMKQVLLVLFEGIRTHHTTAPVGIS